MQVMLQQVEMLLISKHGGITLPILVPAIWISPNAYKTWLIVNENNLEKVKTLIEGPGVNITSEEIRHFGVAIGTHTSAESYDQ